MFLTDGIDVTPQFTLSTIQFHNEVVNTIVTSLLTALVIANLGSVINRLVFLSRRDVFSYRSFARSYIFLNSDDPLRILYWFRGRYDFRNPHQSPTRHRIVRRYLIAPLCARLWILAVSIGSIALALPSEKRLDGCSRGDYTVVQGPLEGRPAVNPLELMEVCADIPLETRLGSVRSSASYCSYTFSLGNVSFLGRLVDINDDKEFGLVAVTYSNSSGLLESTILSKGTVQSIISFVRWNTEKGVKFNSLMPFWNGERHLKVIADGIGLAVNQDCSLISHAEDSLENDVLLFGGAVRCTFDAHDAISHVSAALRESLRFRKEDTVALRARLTDGSRYEVERMCAVDVTVSRPLINMVPLLIGLLFAFCMNVAILVIVSRRGNAMDSAFHLVREVLGHDTGANPLQFSTTADDVENVGLRRYVCADGVSGHVGFVQGLGDTAVQEFYDGRNVGRCLQVACRGPRFVSEFSEKGSV